MNSKECKYGDICHTFLVDYPERIPHKCSECTPQIRIMLEMIMSKMRKGEEWWWDDRTKII